MKKVLVLASNYGLWAEELQAPWDAFKKAGFQVTLATEKGITPLPFLPSVDKAFVDPIQHYLVNPAEVVDRTMELLKTGEWDHPIRIADARASDFDGMAIVGGPGAPLDIVGNAKVHRLTEDFYQAGKILGALCYAVGVFVWARGKDGKSIINGKTVAAHPKEWDFTADMSYKLYNASASNPGTDLVTSGFVFPLQVIVEDAVGDRGRVVAVPAANRKNPVVQYDHPFVTAQSVESSIAFGKAMVEALSKQH